MSFCKTPKSTINWKGLPKWAEGKPKGRCKMQRSEFTHAGTQRRGEHNTAEWSNIETHFRQQEVQTEQYVCEIVNAKQKWDAAYIDQY